jgi:hypothetical protein
VCRIFVMSDARQIEARAGPLAQACTSSVWLVDYYRPIL